MRCPECKHSQKYREGSRCKKCNYLFVFRRNVDRISDYALRQTIQRLSDGGQQAFTATQLALEICRIWRKKAMSMIAAGVVVAVIALAIGLFLKPAIGMVTFLILCPLVLWNVTRSKRTFPYYKARVLVERYHQAHPIAALADGQAFRQQSPTVDPQELQYAPERILVVEHDALVDLLVRNRFHLQHKTAVVSRWGYPARVFAACREFLRNHPDTPVQVLHDASLAGFGLTAQLAVDPQWAFAGPRLVDLGIARTSLGQGATLPWLPPDSARRSGRFSADTSKMLRSGCRVPIDYLRPKPMMNLLGAAVVSGALLLATAASVEAGIEFGGDDFG